MIPVTKPFMPPKEEYEYYLKGIWEREYITNNGPLVRELEEKLKEYLNTKNILFTSNGTIALQIAIKALALKGEIITTPFSYVATTSSIVWEGCRPVFVDIDPNTLNINPDLIEESITENTSGILATHVFGNPCDIDSIKSIADKYDLKVIYDAAHCFGSFYKGKSVFEFGDISTASFHATKIFHTVEGGGIFSNDDEIIKKMEYMRNFGHAGFGKFNGIGINGKNSEFHAAMGLCNLNFIDNVLEKRKQQCIIYDRLLKDLPIRRISIQNNSKWNYSYYPAIFDTEEVALEVKKKLEENEIYPRRYFYPSLETLDYVGTVEMKISNDISKRILCLPLYHELKEENQRNIYQILKSSV